MHLSEAETRTKLVDPALRGRGWTEDLVKIEETAGAVEVIDGRARRRSKGRTDYTLRVRLSPDSQPVTVALIEAKAEHLSPSHGLEQAKAYGDSKRLNVPFVFSTNGHLFVRFERATQRTDLPRPLSEFPTPAELRCDYERAVGFSLEDDAAKPLLTRYTGGETVRRYYQDAAIRAVFEKVAKCQRTGEPKRALLSLATGSGKTRIAVHLLKRLADAGQLRRALFVCDRDELRTQALGALSNVFGADAAAATSGNPQRNARIVVATYQTLNLEGDTADASFLTDNYPPDYFSHIILDECHRSAWGKWSVVLTHNPNAVQIGLTATPRKLPDTDTEEAQADRQVTADNATYFGDPVYEYDMSQGMRDGYLAACQIVQGTVNLDETGITIDQILALKPTNALTGQPVTREELRELYEKTQYEDRILLPDRIQAMAQDLFGHLLLTGGPHQKTIIFCVRDLHADAVAAALNNLYAGWCQGQGVKAHEYYAFKCTAESGGRDYLPELRGAPRSHYIATTVDLLTTGVDVPCLENIVFFRYLRSPIAFYQMVGRGTRIDAPSGKLMFRVYDYTNATRLFGKDFVAAVDERGEPKEAPEPPLIINVEGFDVHVTPAGRYIITQQDGRAVPVTIEEYRQQLAALLVAEAPTLEDFRGKWIVPPERRELIERLPEAGRSAYLLRSLEEMADFDLYDVLAEVGYGLAPRTRRERAHAFSYKHAGWLSGLPNTTSATLLALVDQFAHAGTEGLENPHVFRTPAVREAGGLDALRRLGDPREVLMQTKARVFAG